MPNIGLITCRDMPEPDRDRDILLCALSNAGVTATWIGWDDPAVDAGDFDLCVLRSTWNYHRFLPAFLDWVDRAARVSRVVNPPSVVRWNANKTYLTALAERGLAVVPTVVMSGGESHALAGIVEGHGWEDDFVVKPAVSAGSHNTHRFHSPSDEAQGFARSLAKDCGALVQPYMHAVDHEGERALVQIGGDWIHSVRKSPRFTGDEESITEPRAMNDEEIVFASRILSAVPVAGAEALLYARVDVVRDEDGSLRLAELELIEPSLFLLEYPPALAALARAILDRC